MRDVFLLGAGAIPVAKYGGVRPRQLGAQAVALALADAGGPAVGALYVGNMMSGILSQQQQLGALVAQAAGLSGIEAMTAEAACASGGAAVRLGWLAVASGAHDAVAVCGLEQMTDAPKEQTTAALATASDWLLEGSCGASFISLNARLMAAYMDATGAQAEDFAPFALTAHANALGNPNAFFHKPVDLEAYRASRVLVPPVRLYDASPVCDGAAALVLGDAAAARAAQASGHPVLRLAASAMATDTLGLDARASLLRLDAAARSSERAFAQGGIGPGDVDFFEVHDAYTIITALSLEAAGFAPPGEALHLAREGAFGPRGRLPIATRGGLKGRGHPVGATGVYQLVEAADQLRGRAGANQLARARVAMTQNVGGTGATVVTHLLIRDR